MPNNLFVLEDDEHIDPSDFWKILVVDDDKDIHTATEFALRQKSIHGKLIKFIHAYSGKEAVDLVDSDTSIDLMFLDAVMESPYAGELCACAIRKNMRRSTPIIIMRSGYAPNEKTMKDDCIDDFIHKSHTTRDYLIQILEKWLPYE